MFNYLSHFQKLYCLHKKVTNLTVQERTILLLTYLHTEEKNQSTIPNVTPKLQGEIIIKTSKNIL